eukprot:XP_001707277.1 Hypothetical protein GL50803_36755 [Giardia lamblia ATCC 50803]
MFIVFEPTKYVSPNVKYSRLLSTFHAPYGDPSVTCRGQELQPVGGEVDLQHLHTLG